MIRTRLELALKADRGRLLAALISRTGDFQRAEDGLHEAAASALVHWARSGVPDNPSGWLLRAALRKAIDAYRRENAASRNRDALEVLAVAEATDPDPESIPDERLRLIFTCCHPALEEKTRVALTLRSLCGLTTPQVAAVFLDNEPTMGQRLSRAKTKIAAAGIPYAVPGPEDWPVRLNSVLTVIYLIFTAGYATGPESDLCLEAIFLARLLVTLAPEDAEIEGCLALLLLTQSRAAARISSEGETLPPAQQDRALWNKPMLDEGLTTLDTAIARRQPGPFQMKAAIAALHSAATPDWPQIAALYAGLLVHEPTPVVRLNHAVALAEAGHPERALILIEALNLSDYQPYHAARANLLARMGQTEAACAAYDNAITLATSEADRAFLRVRREALT